ncbi:hypothetical protein BSZ19_02555 [Bradyrhizobium japonicum]|uniref:Uncharacterized protein n=1 Tax=Bradyrhizobium japonicum TaxID=375 RepID=A0A1Y2JZX1_BRAJP|nr:hypothetical protein BSZ19_02555 [Bradyrhizobium japonicum]
MVPPTLVPVVPWVLEEFAKVRFASDELLLCASANGELPNSTLMITAKYFILLVLPGEADFMLPKRSPQVRS